MGLEAPSASVSSKRKDLGILSSELLKGARENNPTVEEELLSLAISDAQELKYTYWEMKGITQKA